MHKTVRDILEIPMYGQQVISIVDEENEEVALITFENRELSKFEEAVRVYGNKQVAHVSSDNAEMHYGKTDCIRITLEHEYEEE